MAVVLVLYGNEYGRIAMHGNELQGMAMVMVMYGNEYGRMAMNGDEWQ